MTEQPLAAPATSLTVAPPAAATVADRPIIGRVNAAFFRAMDWYAHWKYRALKTRLFADLPGDVVELGSGVGANFRYLRPGTRVVAVEPNRHMHRRLARNAAKRGIELDIRGVAAERLELDDDSADVIVCSLVLCTVGDPDAVLAEVLRVLKPGGRFVCIEHVAAPPRSLVGRIQRLVFRPWRWFFDGCHTHRDTASHLRSAGFSTVDIQPFTWRTAFVPVRPQIIGECIK